MSKVFLKVRDGSCEVSYRPWFLVVVGVSVVGSVAIRFVKVIIINV